MNNGIEAIAAERRRQIEVHGYDVKHDKLESVPKLILAAKCYARQAVLEHWGKRLNSEKVPFLWPWDEHHWKPSETPRRNLEKAGALIAAAIDRLDADK
ncbi:hypothetical protein LMG33810_002790 [Carnimonas sp. LMG 33810]